MHPRHRYYWSAEVMPSHPIGWQVRLVEHCRDLHSNHPNPVASIPLGWCLTRSCAQRRARRRAARLAAVELVIADTGYARRTPPAAVRKHRVAESGPEFVDLRAAPSNGQYRIDSATLAWFDYRKDYQPNPAHLAREHVAFIAGYSAAEAGHPHDSALS